MSTEQNKAIVRRFTDASIDSDQTRVKALLAPDFVLRLADGPHNWEEYLQHLNFFQMAFGDSCFTGEEQIAEGEMVVTRATWGGTHSGNFQGPPPTGKQIAMNAMLFDRIQDGKIIEHRSQFDMLSMMQQLGLVPQSAG
jgi:steroid delta-isomerase-like uncharacterized protein